PASWRAAARRGARGPPATARPAGARTSSWLALPRLLRHAGQQLRELIENPLRALRRESRGRPRQPQKQPLAGHRHQGQRIVVEVHRLQLIERKAAFPTVVTTTPR